jgi:flagellar basal-body rod modification protein FlgD
MSVVESTISQIQSAGTTAQQAASSKTSGNSTLDKDSFLKLLTAQLQQQDPTQPMDNTAFVAQLAQFSSLEQLSNANDSLTKMLAGQSTALQTTATSMVGKTAIFNSDEVTLEQGKTATITANLSAAAANVTVVIDDKDGKQVRVLNLGALAAGDQTIKWDGCDDSGTALSSGNYTVKISATDLSGKAISLTQSASAPITGVTFKDGTPYFTAGGQSIQLSDISEVDE